MVVASILAGELREGWVDEHRVAAEDFDTAPGIRVFSETDLSAGDSTAGLAAW